MLENSRSVTPVSGWGLTTAVYQSKQPRPLILNLSRIQKHESWRHSPAVQLLWNTKQSQEAKTKAKSIVFGALKLHILTWESMEAWFWSL